MTSSVFKGFERYLSKLGNRSQTRSKLEKCLRDIIHAMLKRLYIDNFRCFVNFEYRPERKQLLLGANGSGKSSLLEVIRLLKDLFKGREIPFTQSSRTRWQNRPTQVFEIESLIDGEVYAYRVEIRYSTPSNDPSIGLERLSVDGVTVFEFENGELRTLLKGDEQTIFVRGDATESSLQFVSYSNPRVLGFLKWVNTVHCFKIDAYEEKMEEVADAAISSPDWELEYIASWYRHLLEADPAGNDAFRASMREVLTGFVNLRFSSEEDGLKKLRADFNLSGKTKLTVSLRELSDGQRYLIALYMILHFLIAKGYTIFVDEPDNFISLREIQPWLLEAENMALESNGQLILISHHPELLNYWAKDFGLLFFREENGHVRTRNFRDVADTGLEPAETIARGWEDE